VFFQDKALLEELTQHTFTDSEWQAAKHDPKAFLARLFGRDPALIDTLLAKLSEDTIRSLQQHPLVKELSEFLRTKTSREST
jgi:hypothetical protein